MASLSSSWRVPSAFSSSRARAALVTSSLALAVGCASDPQERPIEAPPTSASASTAAAASATPELAAVERSLADEPMVAGEAIFAGNPDETWKRRARVTRYTTLRLERGGALLRASDDEQKTVRDDELPVIDTTASEVRVLLTSYHHRVAGYVPVDTLALVVARPTSATLESGQAPARAKVTLEPGFAGELGEARSGERPVRVKALDLALRVPVAALGRVYEPRKPEPPAGASQALLESGTKLLDGPGGPVLARLAEATSAHALGAAEGAHQRVWLHHAGVTLEAWVDAKSVKPTVGLGTLGTFGFGGLGGYGRSHGEPIPLPKGTKLYASAMGPWIGLAVEESTVYERRSSGGDPGNLRASFEAPLGAFGWPELWVDEATLREGRDHRSQRALREKRITITKAAGPGDAKAAQRAFEGCRVTIAKCVEKAEARASGKVITGAFDVKVERKDMQTVTSRVGRAPSKDAELTSCLEAATLAAAPPRRAGEAVKGTFTATITIGKPVAKP